MRTNWKWTPTAAHSGTAPPVREWPHGWEPTVRRRSAAAIFRGTGTVVIQYTVLGEYSENDPPTYACVGDPDGIDSWRIMKARLQAMQNIGIDTEFHAYPGLNHGFGLGTGTVAEGWLDDAVTFWEKQM